MADNTTISELDAAGALTGTELIEVSQLSTSVLISAATISAQASDNSFNDSGSGFVAAGFEVNNRVNVTGFTGDTANNLLTGRITDLTAGKMTIGGVDGDVIVDDAAGETVIITKWESGRVSSRDVVNIGGLYDFGFVFEDTPPADAIVGRVRIGRNILISADMGGSSGGVSVNPTAAFDIDVQDDNVSIGTISVSTGGVVTFVTDGNTEKSVVAGSEILFIGPSTPDATIEGMSVVIAAKVE